MGVASIHSQLENEPVVMEAFWLFRISLLKVVGRFVRTVFFQFEYPVESRGGWSGAYQMAGELYSLLYEKCLTNYLLMRSLCQQENSHSSSHLQALEQSTRTHTHSHTRTLTHCGTLIHIRMCTRICTRLFAIITH